MEILQTGLMENLSQIFTKTLNSLSIEVFILSITHPAKQRRINYFSLQYDLELSIVTYPNDATRCGLDHELWTVS